MTTTASNEPTLADVIEKLDKLSAEVEKTNDKTDRFNDKFDNYQKATQWVVQLAFTLASATITVIITSVFRVYFLVLST
jgi:molecular chaperone GrpE (heat shock protein)